MGLFDKFKAGLQRTKEKLSHEINRIVTRSPELDAEALEEIEHALISADLGMAMTRRIVEAVKLEYESQGRDGLDVSEIARREVAVSFDGMACGFEERENLTVVSLVGVNGTGKTTTAAKLAHRVRAADGTAVLAAVRYVSRGGCGAN